MSTYETTVSLLQGMSEEELNVIQVVARAIRAKTDSMVNESEKKVGVATAPAYLDMSQMTKAEFDAEMQKGIDAVKEGRTTPLGDAFAEIRRARR